MSSAGAASTAYDAVPYPSAPYWFSHPASLAVQGRLWGLDPPAVETCRVLELGCASGRNLLPMAAGLPGAELVGVERSARQADAARGLAEAAGLDNVTILERGFEQLGDEVGRFDYIVAHGVYSWVSPAIRRELLRVCRERLGDGGLVYASYNTLPGWALPGAVRDLLLFHTRGQAVTSSREGEALGLLERIVAATAEVPGPLAAFYGAELERLRGQRPGYLTHEHLEPENHPVYLETFVGEAREAGLDYFCSALRERMDPSVWPEPLRDLLAAEPDRVRRQQYLDFVVNTRFRASLLIPLGGRPRARPDPAALDVLHARCELPRSALEELDPGHPEPVVLTTSTGREVRVVDRGVKAMLVELVSAAPASMPVAELLSLGDAGTLRAALLQLYLAELVELVEGAPALSTRVPPRPRVSALARAEAAVGGWVTNAWHRPVRLDPLERALIALLDGTRSREQLAAETGQAVEAALEGFARAALLMSD